MRQVRNSTAAPHYNRLIILVIVHTGPENEEYDEKETSDNQEINKDPIIGGADDVYRENPSKDLYDSDLVDVEPLREEGSDLERETDANDIATPYEGDEEDATTHTLKEDGDLLD